MNQSRLKYFPWPSLLVRKESLEIIEGNDPAAKIIGIRGEKLAGKKLARFFPDAHIEPMEFEKTLFQDAAGKQHEVELNIQVYNESQEPCYLVCFRKSGSQFHDLMFGVGEGIVIFDKKLKVLDVNPALCSITDIEREEFVGKSAHAIARKFLSVKDVNKVLNALNQIASRQSVQQFEVEYGDKTLALSTKIRKESTRYIGIIRDVTLEKQTKKALQESEDRLRFFADATFEGIVLHNKGVVIDANDSFLRMTGSTLEEAIGENLLNYIPKPSDKAKILSNMIKRKAKPYWVTASKKDGSNFTVELESNDVKYHGKKVRITAIRDVSKQSALQEQLRDSKEKYKTIFTKTSTANVIIEKDRKISLANSVFADMVGYSIEEIENKMEFTHFVHEDDLAQMVKRHDSRREIPGKTLKEYEFKLVDRQKNIKHIKLFVDVIPGTQQSIASLVDITESKRTRLRLEESGARLKKAQSIAKMGDWSLDLNTGQASGSDETKRIYGLRGESMSAEKITEIHLPEYREFLNLKIHELVSGKSNYDAEFKIKNQETGQILDVHSIAEYNPETNIITGVIQDITKMKEAESEILQRQQYLDSIFRAAPVGIGLVIKRHFSGANKKLCELTGYSEDELLNQPSRMLYPSQEDYERVGRVKYEEIRDQGTGTVETRWRCKDGTIKDILLSSTPIDNSDLLKGVTFTALDITERKNAEKDLLTKNRELILAKEKAEESDRLKTAFLANMSHEIRTPMNGILGFTNLLANPSLSTETRESYIDIINKSGDRLLGTVNDLIDISKLEAGLENIIIEDTEVNEILETLYRFFQQEAEAKGIEFRYHNTRSEKPLSIRTDEKKLNSILTNLVKNAIKYTHEGSVEFGYRKIEEKSNLQLEFYVRDTGIGIPADRQDAVFNRFEQADIEDQNVYEGSGLGLTIAKSLVEMLGGKIWLESIVGKGTTFYFTLPFVQSEGKEAVSIDAKQLKDPGDSSRKLKILIAEDDVASFLHLSILTRTITREVLHVTTGEKAVRACRENPDIDLVLMDIKMPEMNGLEATRQIREFNTSVPIIAQTAYAMHGDREKALEAGCNDHITKPILREELQEKLAIYTGSSES